MKIVETILPVGEVVEIKKLPDGRSLVVQEVSEEVVPAFKVLSEDELVLIEAERLSLGDKFMQHEPCTEAEDKAKNLIIESIVAGVKSFYRPKFDPSFSADGIQFVAGKKPAVGKSYEWWYDVANRYASSRNSRLGTCLEYGAFLGVLIKRLAQEGKTVEWAWAAVCNDSKELGHYFDSDNAKYEFEHTGSRLSYGFYDLGNTCKILAADDSSSYFWLAGGSCIDCGSNLPIATLNHKDCRCSGYNDSVGWIVFS